MKPQDTEDRYLDAYMQMPEKARKLYMDYGDMMELLPAHRNKTAKKLGVSVHVVKQVLDFVALWGGPGNQQLQALLATGKAALPANVHLVIPDAHFSRKDRANKFLRARRLGQYIGRVWTQCMKKGQYLRVVCLGDWWDMYSLNSFERGKAGFSEQNVAEDLATGEAALALMLDAMEVQANCSVVEPDTVSFHFTAGNHELRLDKAKQNNDTSPMVKNLRSHRQIVEDLGWSYHDYMMAADVDGVAYAHCLPSGVMGKPIGGSGAARTLLNTHMVSCVVGHSHLYDMVLRTDAFGGRRFALVAGCYYDRIPRYAKSTGHLWWRGITILNGVRNGCLERGHAAVTVEDMKDVVGF